MGVKDDHHKFAFVEYFEITLPVDKVVEILNRICLRWAADYKTDHSYAFDSLQCDRVEAGERYGLFTF